MKKKILKIGESGHLSDLVKGQSAIVLALHNNNKQIKKRLHDMGITTGVKVKVKKIAPMGDPVDIELRGYELCIRREEMREIDIEVIN